MHGRNLKKLANSKPAAPQACRATGEKGNGQLEHEGARAARVQKALQVSVGLLQAGPPKQTSLRRAEPRDEEDTQFNHFLQKNKRENVIILEFEF